MDQTRVLDLLPVDLGRSRSSVRRASDPHLVQTYAHSQYAEMWNWRAEALTVHGSIIILIIKSLHDYNVHIE